MDYLKSAVVMKVLMEKLSKYLKLLTKICVILVDKVQQTMKNGTENVSIFQMYIYKI